MYMILSNYYDFMRFGNINCKQRGEAVSAYLFEPLKR